MIFSAKKWNNGKELKAVMKVNTAISFDMMEAPLRNAFRQYLVPLLGDAMVGEVVEIYEFGPNPDVLEQNTEGATEREKLDSRLLEICKRANANLAFWNDFDEISMRITDAGFQRQKSDNGESFQQVYKYQEDNLRASLRNKGFNALDELLEFLYAHIAEYPEFASSQAYQDRKSAIVRSTADVNDVCFINGSRIVFLRLQPHLKFAEEMLLQPAIGDKLYEHLIDGLVNPPEDEEARKSMERLRLACSRYIVGGGGGGGGVGGGGGGGLRMETGSVTDRGLYFTAVQPGEKGNEEKRPVDTERIAVQIQNLKTDADMYMTVLLRTVRSCFENFYEGDPRQIYDRDNDHKRTFWT